MELINKPWKRFVVAFFFALITGELISIGTAARKTNTGLTVFLLIVGYALITIFCYWYPRYKMMRDLKRMDEQEESEILDDSED